jgi:hypothetical protein
MIPEDNPSRNLGTEYTEHKIFAELRELADFYDCLSFSIMGFMTLGTTAIYNLDTYVFSSIKGTLESMHDILIKGRINDAYSLLRKYHDSTHINIYTNLYLDDHHSIENFIVKHIDDWKNGTASIPPYSVISKYIKDSDKLKVITDMLQDSLYKDIRDRCNDHIHYNYYHNILLNDNEIHRRDRVKALDKFSNDLTAIFIQHFAYLFYLQDHYMMSSDYLDYLEAGETPPHDAQYWVSPFIQKVFNKWIKTNRSDIAEVLKSKTNNHLE